MPFHNIFSTEKSIPKKEIPKIKISIDYREKNSLVASELVALGFEIEFRELKVADYIVNNVAIERKTISDFLASMLNKRLLNQIEEMQQYENKLLIIEGIDEQNLYNDEKNESEYVTSVGGIERSRRSEFRGKLKKTSGLSSNSVRGFLLSILLKHKIPIILTQNYKDTAKFIERIAKKKETEIGIRAVKKTLSKKEKMQFILEGFPGIGPKNAKKLLEKFSTLQNIFSAPQEELKKLIGKKAEVFMLIEEKY